VRGEARRSGRAPRARRARSRRCRFERVPGTRVAATFSAGVVRRAHYGAYRTPATSLCSSLRASRASTTTKQVCAHHRSPPVVYCIECCADRGDRVTALHARTTPLSQHTGRSKENQGQPSIFVLFIVVKADARPTIQDEHSEPCLASTRLHPAATASSGTTLRPEWGVANPRDAAPRQWCCFLASPPSSRWPRLTLRRGPLTFQRSSPCSLARRMHQERRTGGRRSGCRRASPSRVTSQALRPTSQRTPRSLKSWMGTPTASSRATLARRLRPGLQPWACLRRLRYLLRHRPPLRRRRRPPLPPPRSSQRWSPLRRRFQRSRLRLLRRRRRRRQHRPPVPPNPLANALASSHRRSLQPAAPPTQRASISDLSSACAYHRDREDTVSQRRSTNRASATHSRKEPSTRTQLNNTATHG